MTTPSDSSSGEKRESESLKETLISIIIAFALAFVGRSYVIEPFVIPTGSMAPTLNGAHMRFHSAASGFEWAANPRDYAPDGRTPYGVQGARRIGRPITVEDPVTGTSFAQSDVPLRAGDRILVLKYLYAIFEPSRFDVVVFKNPERPQENFIKRLVGLPNEEVWLSDGDLFVREPDSTDEERRRWRVQRKPRRIQEDVWWPVFSSEYTPLDSALLGQPWRGPWSGDGWDVGGMSYRADSASPGDLVWNVEAWPITDRTPYNDPIQAHRPARHFPVSDVRLRLGAEPDEAGLAATATLIARQHEFQADLTGTTATIRMRREGAGEWTTLATGAFGGFTPGQVTNVAFAHVDQSLELRVDGRRVAHATYEWTPMERLTWATNENGFRDRGLPLSEPESYIPPRVSWSFGGSPVTLHRVGLDRDLHWRTDRELDGYTRATSPGKTFTLRDDQFFMLGDNSPSSRDSRMWDMVDPWVAATKDDRIGVVPRELMMGKAFFVYFPSPHQNLGPIPMPDFGRLRFIK